MRQAGRSLPEYRAVRGTADILQVITEPELVTEITLQPVRRYGVDAAILFSDIMVPLAAIGFGVEIQPGVGPVVSEPFRSNHDLKRLRTFEPEDDAPYVANAIKLLVDELEVPLIGFAGAPFTLAAYLIEGRPSKNYVNTKALMHSEPALWLELTDRLADLSLAMLRAQVRAGCEVVQLFDSWAGALSKEDYERFAYPASRKVLEGIADLGVPRIHFGVGTGELLTLMGDAGADVVGVDWRVPIDVARERVRGKVVQGNLDPAICLAPWNVVRSHVDDVLEKGGRSGHIFNLGHGVLPETNPDVLSRLVEHIHETTS